MLYPLVSRDQVSNGFFKAYEVDGQKLLLIQYDDQIYLIENKCGHFGIVLDTGKIKLENENPVVVCNEHGISFDLKTGEVSNRPYENCQPIRTLAWELVDGMINYKTQE